MNKPALTAPTLPDTGPVPRDVLCSMSVQSKRTPVSETVRVTSRVLVLIKQMAEEPSYVPVSLGPRAWWLPVAVPQSRYKRDRSFLPVDTYCEAVSGPTYRRPASQHSPEAVDVLRPESCLYE